jgi:carbon storage regulator
VLKVEPFELGGRRVLFDVPVIVPQLGGIPMLVLTRKVGEKIRIGDDVVLTILKCGGNTIKLGLEAPAEVKIDRDELPQKTADEFMALAGL